MNNNIPFRDPSLPLSERVSDLLERLTLEEKLPQMTNQAAAIPRLDIPAYDYWSEALHGVARSGKATVFPQAIGMAGTWNPALIQRVASAIGDEGRAKHHAALQNQGLTGRYQGLTMWSPNINIFRDPRWGRGQETWGEDPFLTGEMGSAFVRGLQGDDPRYLKVAACAKHYAVHSGPEKLRHVFDAKPSRHDLYETYLPAFQKLVQEAKVEAVMGAYNRVDGVPACASDFLLTQTLRDEWGFQGHVVSDCWALSNIHNEHAYTKDPVETAAVALKAGCDLSCMCTYDHLGEAIKRGLIIEADIDRALSRTLATRFKLGMFDPPEQVPYASIPLSVVNCSEHRQLAYQAALESVVLLKNQGNILPVGKHVRNIAIVGPNAASLDVLLGNYHGLSNLMTTLLEGILEAAPEGMQVSYRQGCTLNQKIANPNNWSIYEASEADLTIACMGLSPLLEGEEGESLLTPNHGDRDGIELPAVQQKYLEALVRAGAKVVLVLTGGSPIALGKLADKMHAILYVWYPGQEGGRAVGDILFGRANPSGRLPVTFPQSTAQLPPFEDYSMHGRTYRYMVENPLYPFGFGLSYTNFQYSQLELEHDTLKADEPLKIRCTLANHGPSDGEEVVQVYLKDLVASVEVPLHSLIDFRRVALRAGERLVIEFEIPPEKMMIVDEAGRRRLEAGEFEVIIGGCSPGKRSLELGAPQPLGGRFWLETG
jgi:beta-glucosidase